MKRHEIIFSIIKVPLDFVIIYLTFFLARDIRWVTDLIPWISLPIKTISDQNLFYFALFWAFLYIALFFIHGLYVIRITSSKVKELFDIARFSFYWFIFYAAWVYLAKDYLYVFEIPRLVIWFTFIIWTFFVLVERWILNLIQNSLLRFWHIYKRRLVIITNTENIETILNDVKRSWVYTIVWYFNKKKIKSLDYKHLGSMKDLLEKCSDRKVDEILYIDSDLNNEELYTIWDYSRIYGIRYRYITNSFDLTKINTSVTLLHKIPVVEIKNTSLDAWGRVVKRMFDIAFWLALFIVLSPLLLIISILIKLEDPDWPVVYKNKRVGQYGNDFFLYKFRYLKWKYCVKDSYWVDAKNDEALQYENELIKKQNTRKWPLYKIENDPRKTKIWNFIERYSLDELPQLFNVIMWNMSLVWPRPHQPREVKLYKEYERRVLVIKPWMTWMSQVHGRENNTFDDEVKFDVFYIENWSFILDMKILFKTFPVFFYRK